MAKRLASRADAQLLAALKERGVSSNARQLERYRHAKLLLKQRTVSLGRGRGTISYLPEGAVERVAEVKEILAGRRNLRDALFVLFMRGREVDAEALKRAYRSFLSDAASYLRKVALRDRRTPSNPSSMDIAEAFARNWVRWSHKAGLTRDMRNRIKRVAGEETVDALAMTFATQIVYALLEGDLTLSVKEPMTPSHVALHLELDTAAGISAMASDRLLDHGSITPEVPVDAFGRELAGLSLRALDEAIEEASLGELEAARDQMVHLFGLLTNLSRVANSAESREDVAGLGSLREMPTDEAMLAKVVPIWMVIRNRLLADGVEIEPLYDPSTSEGQRHAALFAVLAQIATLTSIPLRPENMTRIVDEAPDAVRDTVSEFLHKETTASPG